MTGILSPPRRSDRKASDVRRSCQRPFPNANSVRISGRRFTALPHATAAGVIFLGKILARCKVKIVKRKCHTPVPRAKLEGKDVANILEAIKESQALTFKFQTIESILFCFSGLALHWAFAKRIRLRRRGHALD